MHITTLLVSFSLIPFHVTSIWTCRASFWRGSSALISLRKTLANVAPQMASKSRRLNFCVFSKRCSTAASDDCQSPFRRETGIADASAALLQDFPRGRGGRGGCGGWTGTEITWEDRRTERKRERVWKETFGFFDLQSAEKKGRMWNGGRILRLPQWSKCAENSWLIDHISVPLLFPFLLTHFDPVVKNSTQMCFKGIDHQKWKCCHLSTLLLFKPTWNVNETKRNI